VRMLRLKSLLAGTILMAGLLMPVRPLFAQQAGADESKPVATETQDANKPEPDENDAYLHSDAVKAIGAKLGMTTEQAATAFLIVNFAVLALGVLWLVVKLLPKTLRDRNTAIQKNLVDARTATEEASSRLNSVEERLSKLDGQIAAMRAQAEKDSAADEQRIKASVEEEKQKILATAEQEIAAATSLAQRQIQKYAAELAIEQAARKLVVSAETDRLLVQGFARQLTGDDSKEGHN
jgi:F-type H+-transporting ATPase subunit b